MTDSWNSSNNIELFKKYVGDTYPDLDAALLAKKDEARYIAEYLKLSNNSTVIDLGPGVGFIASYLVDKVKHLHCVDISKSFLDKSEEILGHNPNVSFQLIKHGNLSMFSNIDAIYCVAVFIHFNLYDIAIYLEEMHKALSPNGKVLIDFYDAEYLEPTDPVFQRHKLLYKLDRQAIVTNINFNSKQAVINICEHVGFDVEIKREGKQPILLLTKGTRE